MTDDLEQMFGAARGARVPSDALMARVLADAEAHQPGPVVASRQAVVAVPLWRRMLAALGGGPMVAGLTCAAAAGVFIGYAGPVTTDWMAAALASGGEVEMIAASDLFLGEG
jgi:hypothetical protein